MDIQKIIELFGTDPKGISNKFGIPLRTVYCWVECTRRPPAYVIMMMYSIYLLEKRMQAYGDTTEGLEIGMGNNSSRGPETRKKGKSKNGEVGKIL